MTASVPLNIAVIVGIACSVIAIAASTELAPRDGRARHSYMALIGGHGVAAAVMLCGIAPSASSLPPLAALAAAAALGGAGLAAVGRAAMANHEPQPLSMAPRVTAIALIVQALLQLWAASVAGPTTPLGRALIEDSALSRRTFTERCRTPWFHIGYTLFSVACVATRDRRQVTQ